MAKDKEKQQTVYDIPWGQPRGSFNPMPIGMIRPDPPAKPPPIPKR